MRHHRLQLKRAVPCKLQGSRRNLRGKVHISPKYSGRSPQLEHRLYGAKSSQPLLSNSPSKSRGEYKIAVYLKYANSAPDKVFEQDVALQDNDVLVVSGSPRTDQTPYEVNVFVGGNLAAGNRYVASASACGQPEVAPETETSPEGPAPTPSPDVAPAPSPNPPSKTPQPAPR